MSLADRLLDLADALADAHDPLVSQVRHDHSIRHAVRLFASDDCDAWLIGWPAGHRTTPHDHGNSTGVLVVLDGELVEHAGGLARVVRAGEAIPLPARVVHDVGTRATTTATSIHVYSPPLTTMTFYDDGTGIPDRVVDVTDDEPVLELSRIPA